LCQNHAVAEDIVSEAFVKVILSIECADRNIKLWMFRVCKNLWVDYHRKNKRLSGVKIEDLDITDKNDFIEGIIRDGRAKAVYKAVLSLAEPYKESIILFYYLDMKQNEIAKILGISDGAARTIIYRARKMLKELLEGVI